MRPRQSVEQGINNQVQVQEKEYEMGEEKAKALVLFVIAGLLALGLVAWYSHTEVVTGTVSSKWTETTPCNTKGCTPTVDFLFQLEDGRIYSFFWGPLHYDKIRPGMRIRFEAKGYSYSLWGWRMAVPEVFSFEDQTNK